MNSLPTRPCRVNRSLLWEIDGIQAHPQPVFLIGATNLPDWINRALMGSAGLHSVSGEFERHFRRGTPGEADLSEPEHEVPLLGRAMLSQRYPERTERVTAAKAQDTAPERLAYAERVCYLHHFCRGDHSFDLRGLEFLKAKEGNPNKNILKKILLLLFLAALRAQAIPVEYSVSPTADVGITNGGSYGYGDLGQVFAAPTGATTLNEWSFYLGNVNSTPQNLQFTLALWNPTSFSPGSIVYQSGPIPITPTPAFASGLGWNYTPYTDLNLYTVSPNYQLSLGQDYVMYVDAPTGVWLGTELNGGAGSPLGGDPAVGSFDGGLDWVAAQNSDSIAYKANFSGPVKSVPDGGSTAMLIGMACLGLVTVGKFRFRLLPN